VTVEPRKQIQDRREVELPAAAGPDDGLSRIADPPLIRRRRLKPSVEQIGRDRLVVIAHGGHFVRLARPRFQAVFLHQSNHALAAHPLLLLDETFVNARAAGPLLALLEGGLHQHLESAIVTGMRRIRPTPPGVEAAARPRADSDRER
jgi:hypothetical protein